MAKKKKKKSLFAVILTNFLIYILLIPFFLCAILFGIAYMYKSELYAECPLEEKINMIESKDNYTKYEDISKCFLEAIVSIEDHRFYTHNGFDLISFSRAMVANAKSGKFSQGGSTITQQLAKNLYLSNSKNVFRKVIELLISFDIEKAYEKNEILELYANIIYYGRDSYGVYNASWTFFNKMPKDLTHDESAYLAGLTQSPTKYSTNEELGNKRKQLVLDAMEKYSNCEHNKEN